ncbi:MAG: hypothetical protein AB1521_03850 [Bacteroidota bacterium]
MNIERMKSIFIELKNEISSLNTVGLFQNVINQLQNQVSQPHEPSYQREVANNLSRLEESLKKSPSNDFSPVWRKTLEELQFDEYFGTNLLSKIELIFSKNQITPARALDELKKIFEKLKEISESINQVLSGLSKIKIEAEILKPGECEVGVLIPREAIKNTLGNLTKELNEVDIIFSNFEEIVTGKRSGIRLRTISSSEPSFFFDTLPAVAAFTAVAVERILALYKNLLEIKKLHKELKENGVPEDDLKGIEQHANELIEKGVEKLLPELFDKYAVKLERQRENELRNSLRISLNKLANRVDRGYNIEVRAKPPEEKKEGDIEEASSINKDSTNIKVVLEKSKSLRFIKSSGDPILCLPEDKEKKS